MYHVILSLNYGTDIFKNYQNLNDAVKMCKAFIANCDVIDFGGCLIHDGWMDTLYECTKGGFEKYFVKWNECLNEVSEKTFKTVYGVN